MSLIDKFRIIEDHIGLKETKYLEDKVENYFENLINLDFKLLSSDYINQIIWFDKINKSNLASNVSSQIKKYLTQRRNNIRALIKKQNFELIGLNKFLKSFMCKLEYINNIIKNNDIIIKEGISNLASLIISDSIILLFIEEELILFDKDKKQQFEYLIIFCKKLSKYDSYDIFNKLLRTFGNMFNKDLVKDINVPLPENIKRIQKLNNTIKYCEKVNTYFDYIKEHKIKFCIPILNSLLDNIIDIIRNNTPDEIYYVLSVVWHQFQKLVLNNNFENRNEIIMRLSTEITNMIDKTIKGYNTSIFTLINIISLFDIINKKHKEIINMKLSYILSSDDNIDMVHEEIDNTIKLNNMTKLFTLLEFVTNIKNKDIFIAKYYERLIKRLITKITTKDSDLSLEQKSCEFLKANFGMKLIYKIEKVIHDAQHSIVDNKNFNNIMTVITTSYGMWDINQCEGLVHSKMYDSHEGHITTYMKNYDKYYSMRYDNKRILNWFPHFGEVNMTFMDHEFILLPIQMMVVEMFEKENSLPIETIKKASFFGNYSSKFINDIIGSLVQSNLFKINNSNMILATSSSSFKSNLIEIFFTTSDYAEVWEQKREEEFKHTRHEIVCANINNILKKNSLNKSDLFEKVKSNINIFELEHTIFNKSVEYLIDKDYIKLNNDLYEKIFY